jgi:hypothetical protein
MVLPSPTQVHLGHRGKGAAMTPNCSPAGVPVRVGAKRVRDASLELDADANPHPYHANIVGWHDEPGTFARELEHHWIHAAQRLRRILRGRTPIVIGCTSISPQFHRSFAPELNSMPTTSH